jgi:hypothetical protein
MERMSESEVTGWMAFYELEAEDLEAARQRAREEQQQGN